ncbi:DUF4142 domain-containing protein [Pedobacter sp. JY14-1]|uniref:DUF4142 domain-containing protein n=1 Tax=Pedobacter sp. JY14-1 TaxID=3034151 RepID=UPI0023E276DE|nr:DUF4142 domain-containing protein [Pedobacter sp. JY14-1]
MKYKFSALLAAVFAVGILASCGSADSRADRIADSTDLGDRADSASRAQKADNRNEEFESNTDDDVALFMKSAAAGSKIEIMLGEKALQSAANADVKKFAQRMIDDHTKAGKELEQLSTEYGILLPTELPADVRQHMEAMGNRKGANFDRSYMEMMVKDHGKTVNMFREAAALNNNKIKDFAAKTLPVLQEHEKMAKEIFGRL